MNAYARTVTVDSFLLALACSFCSFRPMEWRGSFVCPVANSLIEDWAHPQNAAICVWLYPACWISEMVSTQFMPPLSGNRLEVQGAILGLPMNGRLTLPDMKERSPFGERLFQARTHAKLTQAQLAAAAGVSQGTLGELEWKHDGSGAVVRLAMACGVRPEWLAEGEGDMLDPAAWPFELVTLDEILALTDRERGIVEGAMVNTLERLRVPTPDDIATFSASRTSVKKTASRRKAA